MSLSTGIAIGDNQQRPSREACALFYGLRGNRRTYKRINLQPARPCSITEFLMTFTLPRRSLLTAALAATCILIATYI